MLVSDMPFGVWRILHHEMDGIAIEPGQIARMAHFVICPSGEVQAPLAIWGSVKYHERLKPSLIASSVSSLEHRLAARERRQPTHYHIFTVGVVRTGVSSFHRSIDLMIYLERPPKRILRTFSVGIFKRDEDELVIHARQLTLDGREELSAKGKGNERPLTFVSSPESKAELTVYKREALNLDFCEM